MKKLKKSSKNLITFFISFLIIIFVSKSVFSDEVLFEIEGNQYTDTDAIISLLKTIPENADRNYSNDILKILNDSKLFSEVRVEFIDNKFIIKIKEFPNIDKLKFKNNERLDDDELEIIAKEVNLVNYNLISVNIFINEVKKIYETFGYNNVEIEYYEKFYNSTNTVDLIFDVNEGNITKISNILINGNDNISSQEIREIIKSKTKSIRNIFANNNYKPIVIERDKNIISNFYKNKGYLDINVEAKIEYFKSNKVNIYFNLNEGDIYNYSAIRFSDEENILDNKILDLIEFEKNIFLEKEKPFSLEDINQLKNDITSIIIKNGLDYFEISSFEKIKNNKVEIFFQLNSIQPQYTKQINIIGNTRTFDYVIRRELEIVEGDAIYESQIQNIKEKLTSLNLFEKVNIRQENNNDDSINLIIEVEEKQTGTFNAGVSVGTLDGFAIVTGLKERNFYGTGRSVDFLINTSEDKNQFKLITTDRLSYENDSNISYNLNYVQQDFSKASSYKLDTFSSGVGIAYKVNKNLFHNIELDYVIKDYKITDSNTVSDAISKSSGGNISYLLKNNLRFSTLNRGFIPKSGNSINFNNTIETPTSSNNGFVRNILTFKNYYSLKNNIFSIQTKFGNIFSLNNNDILTDDKFSLGGRWLRGFDNFGAGPRNSRSSYVGGNNLIVSKLDFSYAISDNSNFPIYLSLFNDYGLLWENKTKPTQNDNSIRASAGFGIKYYSPIGPIGFTWGFPIMDEEYDIKRMFSFSIGNID